MVTNSGRFKKNNIPWNKGKKMSDKKRSIMEEKIYNKRRKKNYKEIYGEDRANEIKLKQIKSFTPDRIDKIKKAHYGKKLSKEHKKHISIANIGRECSLETRKKIGDKHKGNILSKETRKKISISKLGKKRNKESIEKMKETMKFQYNNGLRKRGMLGKKLSEEERKKMSIRMKEEYKNGIRKPIRMCGKKNPFYGKTHTDKVKEKLRKCNTRENSNSWAGGISFEPYSISFNNKFKKQIRERDNNICMLCGIHIEQLDKELSIHHIDYNKLLSIPENCISLCDSCHAKTNYNRPHWKKFFQSLLTERYYYDYYKDYKIIGIKNINEVNNV